MQRKMYTAFVSSVSSLKEERRATLDVLLDLDVFPVATEHFVIQSKDGINDIERLIDDSDFFILLMGSEYGPKTKIGDFTGSWTEYELVYALEHARSNNTKIIIIELPELKRISSLSSSEKETLKTSEKNQLGFLDRLNGNTICQVADISSLKSTLSTFIEGNRRANSASGWVRALSAQGCFGIEFGRTYRQVHLSPNDDTYIRVGTAVFSCSKQSATMVHVDGVNHKASLDASGNIIPRNGRSKTEWQGEYSCQDGRLCGVSEAYRRDNGAFGGKSVTAGHRRGVQEFAISDGSEAFMDGTFQDAVGRNNINIACKSGEIYFFESEELMNRFLKRECPELFCTLPAEG